MNAVPDVAVVLGTFNRLSLLQASVQSIRRAAGRLKCLVIAVDGGSTDGSREWLAGQGDVFLVGERGPLRGAVRAFNRGFSVAVEEQAPFVGVLNDDDFLMGPEPEIQRAVEMMRGDPGIGAVVFESDLRSGWACERWRSLVYPNKGIIRRKAGMAAARALGDPTGRSWWGNTHHTYAADTEHGLWMWRLGWRCEAGEGLRVHDCHPQDALQTLNREEYKTVQIFQERWRGDAADYNRVDAERFGGLVR